MAVPPTMTSFEILDDFIIPRLLSFALNRLVKELGRYKNH